jgi:hypothetical protein
MSFLIRSISLDPGESYVASRTVVPIFPCDHVMLNFRNSKLTIMIFSLAWVGRRKALLAYTLTFVVGAVHGSLPHTLGSESMLMRPFKGIPNFSKWRRRSWAWVYLWWPHHIRFWYWRDKRRCSSLCFGMFTKASAWAHHRDVPNHGSHRGHGLVLHKLYVLLLFALLSNQDLICVSQLGSAFMFTIAQKSGGFHSRSNWCPRELWHLGC